MRSFIAGALQTLRFFLSVFISYAAFIHPFFLSICQASRRITSSVTTRYDHQQHTFNRSKEWSTDSILHVSRAGYPIFREALNEVFNRNGGLRRRPLQRIIRYHQKEVRCAFARRRDDIASLLLLRGYRRKETEHSLPSNELLVTTGLDKVWAVRLMRRKQTTTGAEDLASAQDLRTACNERVGDRKSSENVPKQPKEKKTGVRLDVTQKAQSSILTALEEEIAWVRWQKVLSCDYFRQLHCSSPIFLNCITKLSHHSCEKNLSSRQALTVSIGIT